MIARFAFRSTAVVAIRTTSNNPRMAHCCATEAISIFMASFATRCRLYVIARFTHCS